MSDVTRYDATAAARETARRVAVPPPALPRVNWAAGDVEQRLGVHGGRFTNVNLLFTGVVAAVLTVGFYAALLPFHGQHFADMFTERGAVQYATVFFFAWCLTMLLVKTMKVRLQRRALSLRLLPGDPDFELTPASAVSVVERLRAACDDPRRFLLLNRIDLALTNLRNMGRIADFEGVLDSHAAGDEDAVENSYLILRGLNWAIPVLGFIGTVQGLSVSIAGFGAVLAESGDVDAIKPALQGVTGGLATAFETTLVALVAALIVQLLMTLERRTEEALLDDCREFCQRQLVARLRLVPEPAKPSQPVQPAAKGGVQ